MKAFFKILVISAILISCRNANNLDENRIIIFDLKELPENTTVKLSDLGFVDIEYIPLETKEQCMIPRIMEIETGKDYFIIQCFTTIFKFLTDGSFVTKIGTVGRGPNEFTVVHDLDIDRENQKIYLADGWQKKFYVFSESGECIKTFRTPIYAAITFRITEDGILCYNMNQFANVENSYNLIDTAGEIIKYFPNKYPWNKIRTETAIFDENLFYRFNNQLFKKEVYSDTVYVYENMDFTPHLIIEHGKRLLTTEARTDFEPLSLFKKVINQKNLFEFGDYIYYEFVVSRNGDRHEGLSFIGSKKNDFQVLVDPEKDIINDLDGGLPVWPKTIQDDNTIISWVEAIQLKILVTSEAFKNSTPKYPGKKKELEKLANSLKETDNPVIMMIRLKK